MRLFIAVKVSDEQKREVHGLQLRLQEYLPGVKWVAPEGLHLTLKFLGETEPERLADIVWAMKQAASRAQVFSFRLGGTGVFPHPAKARVLWAGMMNGVQEITRLAADLDHALENKNFPPESRPFSPHLTLGRLRYPLAVSLIRRFLEEERKFLTAAAQAPAITLFQSRLSPSGAVYSPVEKIYF